MCVCGCVCVCVCLCVSPAGQHIGLNPFCDYINCPELTLKCVFECVFVFVTCIYGECTWLCLYQMFLCLCVFVSISVYLLCVCLMFAFVCVCICLLHMCACVWCESACMCVHVCVAIPPKHLSHPPSLPNTLPVGHKCPHNSRRLRRQGCTLC